MSEQQGRTGPFDPSRSQFALPHGIGGWLAGWLMTRTNQQMYRWAVDLLAVQPEDHLLEIGFGTGSIVAMLIQAAHRGLVAGVDPSELMLQQAIRRNRAAQRSGRVDLRLGTASSLPFAAHSFDKICAVNSFQLWQSPQTDLQEVRRVLKPGGLLLIGLRIRNPDNRYTGKIGFTPEQVESVRDLLARVGFTAIRTEPRQSGTELALYIRGVNST